MEPSPSKKRKVDGIIQEDVEATSIQVVDLSPTSNDQLEIVGPSSTSNNTVVVQTPQETQTQMTGQMDSKLRELLLSSPAHLFGLPTNTGGVPTSSTPQSAVTSWENWLCVLATNLSPAQWQGYWLAHCALFGEQAVPVHLLSFFQGQTSPSSSSSPTSSAPPQGPHPNDEIHERYGTLSFILGGIF